VDADPQADGQPGSPQFLDDLEVGLVRLTATTVVFGVRQAEQARPAQRRELRSREPPLALGIGDPRP